jgi:hypothetical protein
VNIPVRRKSRPLRKKTAANAHELPQDSSYSAAPLLGAAEQFAAPSNLADLIRPSAIFRILPLLTAYPLQEPIHILE